jgi:hypothetical protein
MSLYRREFFVCSKIKINGPASIPLKNLVSTADVYEMVLSLQKEVAELKHPLYVYNFGATMTWDGIKLVYKPAHNYSWVSYGNNDYRDFVPRAKYNILQESYTEACRIINKMAEEMKQFKEKLGLV